MTTSVEHAAPVRRGPGPPRCSAAAGPSLWTAGASCGRPGSGRSARVSLPASPGGPRASRPVPCRASPVARPRDPAARPRSGTAVVLAGLDPSARAVLALLDGTRDLDAVRREAVAAGCAAERADTLLGLLQEGGLVVDAAERWPDHLDVADPDRLGADVASLSLLHGGAGLAALRRRDAASVVVVGAGRVGAPWRHCSRPRASAPSTSCDPGTARARDVVVGGLGPSDVGRPRGEAAREPGAGPRARDPHRPRCRAPTSWSSRRSATTTTSTPDLLAARRRAPPARRGARHRGRGRAAGAARQERVPAVPTWPGQTATRAGRPWPRSCPAPAACPRPATVHSPSPWPPRPPCRCSRCSTARRRGRWGGSLELALPGWRWRRRSWTPHPACECRWQEGA